MRYLTTILATLISMAAAGQTRPAEFNKWTIGVTASPDIAYRTLENNNGGATGAARIKDRNENERPRLGFTAGLSICYNFSSRFGIETGLQYALRGWAFETSDLNFGDQIEGRRGLDLDPDGPRPVDVTFRYNFHYLDIPLRLVYSYGEGNLRFVSSIGVTTGLLIGASRTGIVNYEDGNTTRDTGDLGYDFNNVNFSPTVSIGIDYHLGDRLNLRVEPTFRYGLLQIVDAPVTEYLWSGGVQFTCYYPL